MGKTLVILGADFSENGINEGTTVPLSVDSWTDNSAYVAENVTINGVEYTVGQVVSSSSFKTSNKVALPAGAAILKYTRCIYTTSGGKETHWGLVFWDSNNEGISGDKMPMAATSVETVSIAIPEGAVSVSFTYFKSSDTSFLAEALVPTE